MGLTLYTAPTLLPVSDAEIKAWLRVDHTHEDTLLRGLIGSATKLAQTITRRQFVSATYRLKLAAFPYEIELPRPPLQSVMSVTYYDENGTSQTLATSVYEVDTSDEPGRITLAYQQAWPMVRTIAYPVTVEYVAGYGAPSAVPEDIKTAIKLIVAHWFYNRENNDVPVAAKSLLESARYGSYV